MDAPRVGAKMSKRWLVIVSGVAHAAAAVGLFATGIWKLERVDPGRATLSLGVMTPLADPGGGGAAAPTPAPAKKPVVRKKKPATITQPVAQPVAPVPEAPPTETSGEGDGAAAGAGHGDGDEPPGPGGGSGPGGGCEAIGGCSPAPPVPVPPVVVAPRFVPPTLFTGLRIAGDTQIVPPDPVKTEMLRDGKHRTVGTLKVCLDAAGRISSVAIAGSTAYPAYDAKLVGAVRDWRYAPYRVNGTPAPACSMVTFVYTIR